VTIEVRPHLRVVMTLCGLDVLLLQYHPRSPVAARVPYRLDGDYRVRYFQPVAAVNRASRPSLLQSFLGSNPLLVPSVYYCLLLYSLQNLGGYPPWLKKSAVRKLVALCNDEKLMKDPSFNQNANIKLLK